MEKGRVEAFSDGVFAIIMTIMVLELRAPHGERLADLRSLWPIFLSYVLSFIYVGIYWNNHHHMFKAVREIRGGVLWANLHLLFWLSLIPFVTAWAGENHFAPAPVALYGFVLMMCGAAYFVLSRALIASESGSSLLKRAIGNDFKGKISVVIYAAAIALAFWSPPLAGALYVAVAVIWIVPDRRIEDKISVPGPHAH
jgi:uncharacterized membrane protein